MAKRRQLLAAVLFFAAFYLPVFITAAPASVPEYKKLSVEGADRPEVETYRRKYLTTHRKWLADILDEAELYRIYVRRELEERKMPSFLEYLPVVESNYLPSARSKSGATGMWQFMANSTKPFLECSKYVDERLDPWKSTQAALSKLQENYNMFGDWLLAIAAYNCGAGAMKRALQKSPEKNFWYLASHNMISNQAAQYVPKLLAIADITENTEYYGIELPDISGEREAALSLIAGKFDYVTVRVSVSIKQLAHELRIDEGTLTSLNSALIKGVTPPDSEYEIRLPAGMKTSAEHALYSMGILTINTGTAHR